MTNFVIVCFEDGKIWSKLNFVGSADLQYV